jgi:hypothetical protein
MKVKINKIIKTIIKKYITDFCSDGFNSQSNIFIYPFGGPPRIRIWNLPVRSRAPYPIWPAVLN